ncbi:MAG: hypothetical protein DRO99_00330 [Candidatus Aenigmatarchaeota archaeon]|nr:MAG: hypothetical protein DRO99_00330 [Candidatus Aenigmarchaeota archaeon]
MTDFRESVWKITRRIPEGRVTTYKAIADRLGTRCYRAVGQALKRNPCPARGVDAGGNRNLRLRAFAKGEYNIRANVVPFTTPCHRVVMSDGRIGGYQGSGAPGIERKERLLRKEGVEVRGHKVDLDRFMHKL